MSNFAADVAACSLPEYTFIEPNYDLPSYKNGDSMHPLNDVQSGETLVKQVYETLRGSDYYWEKLLLIITFDEHDGFYDHVPPPATAPTGDDSTYADPKYPFQWDKLGIRVPNIVISAYASRNSH